MIIHLFIHLFIRLITSPPPPHRNPIIRSQHKERLRTAGVAGSSWGGFFGFLVFFVWLGRGRGDHSV